MNNNERWQKDPEYRKEVIRELEQKGIITPLHPKKFGELVYGVM